MSPQVVRPREPEPARVVLPRLLLGGTKLAFLPERARDLAVRDVGNSGEFSEKASVGEDLVGGMVGMGVRVGG